MPALQTLNFAFIVAFSAGSTFWAWYLPKPVLSLQAVEHGALSDGLVALQKHKLRHASAELHVAAASDNGNK